MKRFTFSLKGILLFSFILVGGLPILVMGFIAGRLISADIAQDVRAKNLLIAQSLSSEVHIFLEKSFSFLKQIEATVIEKQYVEENEINAYLDSSLKTNGDFDSVEILDEEGVVRFMAPPDPDVIGINRSGEAFFSHVRLQHQPYWSPTFISMQTEKPTLTLTIPVKGGMIVGYLDLASLNAVTDKVRAGRQGYALMVDEEGTIITHPDRKKISERQNLSYLIKFSGKEKQPLEGSFSYREDDRDYLASFSHVPETQWTVIVTVPADEAFEPVARVRVIFATGAVVVVLLAVTIVLLSLRKALNPLSQLVRDTRRITEGDYVFEERPSSYREIDDLVGHFHRMAEVIRSREEALRESEALLNATGEMAKVGGWEVDGETLEVRWTQETHRIHEVSLDYKPPLEEAISFYHPEDRERLTGAVQRALTYGEPFDLESRIITAKETHLWTRAICKPQVDGGKTVKLMGTFQDITNRKRAEAERIKLERQLQQALKAESLGRMAGAIAHHFNNKLMVVMGNLELALYSAGSNEKLSTLLLHAQTGASQAAEVSSLMLAYLGQALPQAETFDVAKVCREVVETQRSSVPKGVIMKIDIPPHGPFVSANQAQVKQILSNLTVNAWEAFGEGGGDIRVSLGMVKAAETSSPHLFPAEWKPERDTYACIEVSDKGCGINPEQLDLIFDPFFSTKFTGRGLGLAVVLGTVRSYGGAIAVESEPGRGSIFRIFWPIAEQETQPLQKAEADVSKASDGPDLALFVDDDVQLRDMAEMMLGHLGFKVIKAGHGLEAVEIFGERKDEISLVILDLTMPGMNGWETLEALRTLRHDIPVVLSSGYDEAQVMEEGAHAERPQAFLHKPYSMAELKAALAASARREVG